MTEFNLDDLLADLLDDTKPLPTAAPTIIAAPVEESKSAVEPFITPVVGEDPVGEAFAAFSEALPIAAPQPDVASLATPALDDAMAQLAKDVAAGRLDPQPNVTPFADTADRIDNYTLPPLAMPTFTNDEIASTLDLRNFATLVTLNTRRWHAKVKDRKASQDIADANDADATAFETRKNLLAGADSKLRKIHKEIDGARADFYLMTLPWTTTSMDDTGRRSGARMMPNTAFFDCISKLGARKAATDKAVDEFVPDYPNMIEEAKKKLGRRFDITDYPNVDSIRSHFDISFDFHPIPVGGDFKGLPEAQCQALADALQGKTKKMLENAMQDLWVRVHENVGRMAERLSHPDKLFHFTLVENVRSVANQLKHLNVTNDRRIEELRQYIDANLCQHDVEALRTTPTLRMQVGAHAQTVLDMMARMAQEG